MKTLVAILTVGLCLLAPQSSAAGSQESNPKIENVWVKIKGQWDHNDSTVVLIKKNNIKLYLRRIQFTISKAKTIIVFGLSISRIR